MAEKSLSDQLSHLINDTLGIDASPEEETTDEQQDILAASLQAVAGRSDPALETALDEFLEGKGVLHETTRLAATRGGNPLADIVKLLTSQFKLSPAVAKILAALILKLQPSAGKETGKETAAKKKPRRKAKPKPKTTASAKKGKKKTTAKAKKPAAKARPGSAKKTAAKKTAKKKTAAKTAKKKTPANTKPKKAKRTNTVEIP